MREWGIVPFKISTETFMFLKGLYKTLVKGKIAGSLREHWVTWSILGMNVGLLCLLVFVAEQAILQVRKLEETIEQNKILNAQVLELMPIGFDNLNDFFLMQRRMEDLEIDKAYYKEQFYLALKTRQCNFTTNKRPAAPNKADSFNKHPQKLPEIKK